MFMRTPITSLPCTVLMIGGGDGDQRRYRDMLVNAEALDCALIRADSVADGMRRLAGRVDLIICDLSTSDEPAAQTVRKLRQDAQGIPILVLSPTEERAVVTAALREGADDCLDKRRLHAAMLERVVRNTIERDRHGRRLRAIQSGLNTLIANNADAIVVVSLHGVIRFVNKAAEVMFGRELDTLVGTPFGCPIAGPGRTEVDILRPGLSAAIAEMHLALCEWEGETVYLATLRDISERKAAEGALRRYERIFAAFSDPVAVIDQRGRVTMANQSFQRWFWPTGDPAPEAVLADLLDADLFEEKINPGLRRCATGEEAQIQTWITLPGGQRKYTTMTFDPFRDEDLVISGCIWTLRDLSETKSLEDQLRQSQKMEAIGTLAGGIAHNFNNLLMGIQGRSSLMLMDTTADHPFLEHLHGIEALVQEAAGLTKQLLGYARGGKYDPVPTELNTLVAKNLRMFASTRKEIETTEDYANGLWRVEVDRSQLNQVLLNIFVNAWQAMPEGGQLSVTTANTELDTRAAATCGVAPGRYAVISIKDSGRGMSRTTLQRIFDPFFTTQHAGRGAGLGLASAYGIIRNHDGFIDVDSDLGKGTRFSVYLPATDRAVISYDGARHRVVKGSETILLVDDEADIREVGRRLMVRLGYQVKTAGNGPEALAIYQAEHAAIDLVVLDMIMPKMGGGEVFDRMREIDPHANVLLASGYSLEGKADKIMARGCNGFIQKPFDISELSVKLRSLLDPS
jgi:signal transduction histidine kinase/DNA-binding response OmpR family regulator